MPTSTLDGNQESEKERSGLSIAIAAFFSNPARCATTLVGRANAPKRIGRGVTCVRYRTIVIVKKTRRLRDVFLYNSL
jgi:hypothetical protein